MIPKDKWFYFVGGRSASSIEQLKEVLEQIDDPEFVFHVNSGKNDFANWVEFVFHKPDLARDMRRVQEKKDLILELEKYLEQQAGTLKEPFPADKYYLPDNFADEIAPPQKPKELVLPMFETHHEEPVASQPEEKGLKEADLRKIAAEAEQELHVERHHRQHKHHKEHEAPRREFHEPKTIPEATRTLPPRHEDHRFIVKEFIYGFILGLIFGLIMLGVIFQLNCPGGLGI